MNTQFPIDKIVFIELFIDWTLKYRHFLKLYAYELPAIPFISARIIFVSRPKIDRSFGEIDKNPIAKHFSF